MASGAVYKKQAQMMSKKASLQGLFSWLIFFDFSCHRSRLLVFWQMLPEMDRMVMGFKPNAIRYF